MVPRTYISDMLYRTKCAFLVGKNILILLEKLQKKMQDCECFMAFPWCLPQHLVQWDAGNSECLLQLVKELIQQYHNYQCERLRESSRLLFEYDSLLEDPDYGRNMEIYAGKKNSWVSDCFSTP